MPVILPWEKDCHTFLVSSCDGLGCYNSSNLLFSLVWNCCSNGLYFNSLIVLFLWNGFSQVVKPKSNCGFARFSTLPFWDWLSLLVALSLTFHVFTLYSKISYKIHRVLQLKCNLFTFLVEVIALKDSHALLLYSHKRLWQIILCGILAALLWSCCLIEIEMPAIRELDLQAKGQKSHFFKF